MVFSCDRCAYVYTLGNITTICCNDIDRDYFYNYFDLDRDYSKIVENAKNSGYKILNRCASLGKGIRILNQDKTEMLFSFIISQNNNIPRIKGIIERLCKSIGQRKEFLGKEYYAFPTIDDMAKQGVEFYTSIGLGYRAEYIKRLADDIYNGFDIEELSLLQTPILKKGLLSIYGVGPKVADCVSLFGFHRADSFPVDTWIEKVYREDFNGKLLDRKKIAEWFTSVFKGDSGYFQQYLFYYKRSLERVENSKM